MKLLEVTLKLDAEFVRQSGIIAASQEITLEELFRGYLEEGLRQQQKEALEKSFKELSVRLEGMPTRESLYRYPRRFDSPAQQDRGRDEEEEQH